MRKKIGLILLVFMTCAISLLLCSCGKTSQEEVKEYKIYYYSEGIEGARKSMKIKPGELFTISEIPQKTGYTFLGYYDKEANGIKYTNKSGESLNSFNLEEDLILYPVWEANTYEIKIEDNFTNELITTLEAVYDEELPSIDECLYKEGYVFLGLNEKNDESGTQYADKNGWLNTIKYFNEDNFSVDSENKLFATYEVFVPTVNVTFKNTINDIKFENGTDTITKQVPVGEMVDAYAPYLVDPADSKNILASWSLNDSIFNTPVESSLELSANWIMPSAESMHTEFITDTVSEYEYIDLTAVSTNINSTLKIKSNCLVTYIKGDAEKVYEDMSIEVATSNKVVNLVFDNVKFKSPIGKTAIAVDGDANLRIISINETSIMGGKGKNNTETIEGSNGDGCYCIKANNLILCGELYLVGGDGANGEDNTGDVGGNGGTAIKSNNVCFNDAIIYVSGGNGGNGGNGKACSSVPSDKPTTGLNPFSGDNGYSGQNGGNGGNSGRAIETFKIYINSNSIVTLCEADAGNGGNGGKGGRGGKGSDSSWFFGNIQGGNGGNGGKILIPITINNKTEFRQKLKITIQSKQATGGIGFGGEGGEGGSAGTNLTYNWAGLNGSVGETGSNGVCKTHE